MKKAVSVNDKFIEMLLDDPDYMVLASGEIMTRVDRAGHRQNIWRPCLTKHKSAKSRCSYWRVQYKRKHLQAHRIVYAKFVGALRPDMVINHKDGDGLNNYFENLEMITVGQNTAHRYQVLGHAPVIGNKKITQKIADKIRADRAKGLPYKALCAKYGLNKASISGIINGKTWKAS